MSENEKKRTLPTHVDGRVKIGLMTIPSFITFVIVGIVPFLVVLSTMFNPMTLFFGVAYVVGIGALFCELNNRESGLDMLKDAIRYYLEGDIHFERSTENVSDTEKLIRNRIGKKEDSEQE